MNTVTSSTMTNVDLLGLDASFPTPVAPQVDSGLEELFVEFPELSEFTEISSDVFHPNQVVAAREILSNFKKSNIALLLAQMQSGKTGTFLCAACAMVHYKMVENVVVFTSVPEVDLYNQLNSSVVTAVDHFTRVFPDSSLYYGSGESRIQTIKSSDLPHATIPDNSLVIWDESHFAQDTNNRPFTFFQNNGLLIDGSAQTNQLWADKNCFLLTVSATPFAEYLDCVNPDGEYEITKSIIRLLPGIGYRGVAYYRDMGKLNASFNIFSKTGAVRFNQLMRSHEIDGYPQYGILRVRNSKTAVSGLASFNTPSEAIQFLAMRRGWKVIFYDQKHKEQMPGGWNMLETQPEQNTLIVLKDMGRVGQVIPKQFVSFVFENVKSTTHTDTVLQSLLGRMCGYGPFGRDIDIYINGENFQENEIDEAQAERNLEYKLSSLQKTVEDIREVDEFAAETYQERMEKEIRDDHQKTITYQKNSEIDRYIYMMELNSSDIPRIARNINSKRIRSAESGQSGYSTVPFVIDTSILETARCEDSEDTNWTPLVSYANGELKRVTKEKRELIAISVKEQLETSLREGNTPFGDKKQSEEVIHLLGKIIQDGECMSRINFGNLGSNVDKKLSLRMKTAIDSQMPYVDAASRNDWLKNDKRIQIMVRNTGNSVCEQGGVPLSKESKLVYVTAVTYEAQEHTKSKHIQLQSPTTTGKEVFHIGHELCDDVTYTWMNYIKNLSDFHGFLETIFPANKKIALVFAESIPKSAIDHMSRLIAIRDGRFTVDLKSGRPSLEEKKLGAISKRYKIHFFSQSSLSTTCEV